MDALLNCTNKIIQKKTNLILLTAVYHSFTGNFTYIYKRIFWKCWCSIWSVSTHTVITNTLNCIIIAIVYASKILIWVQFSANKSNSIPVFPRTGYNFSLFLVTESFKIVKRLSQIQHQETSDRFCGCCQSAWTWSRREIICLPSKTSSNFHNCYRCFQIALLHHLTSTKNITAF